MGHQAKKRFGQNFLTDTNLLKKIVDESKIKDKNVLEIGPGLGALTQFLVKDAKKYLAYEIDYSLMDVLEKFKSEKSKFIFIDFLESNVNDELMSYFNNEEIHLVGNLPYYITTPIIFKFLEIESLKTATIMVQKEVGERMMSKEKDDAYNGLSVILQYFSNVTKVVSVNRKMFNPVPKVDSMVIKLEKIEARLPKEEEKLFIEIVKASFAHKRKTLINNLNEKFGVSKADLEIKLSSLGLDKNIRAENLSVENFISMTKIFDFTQK